MSAHGILFDSAKDLLRRLKRRGLVTADVMTKDDRYQAQRLIGSNMFADGDELLTVAFVEWIACRNATSLPTPPTIDSVLRYIAKPAASIEQWRMYVAHKAAIEHRDVDESATAQLSAADELARQNVERRRTRRDEVDGYTAEQVSHVSDVLSGWRAALQPTDDR